MHLEYARFGLANKKCATLCFKKQFHSFLSVVQNNAKANLTSHSFWIFLSIVEPCILARPHLLHHCYSSGFVDFVYTRKFNVDFVYRIKNFCLVNSGMFFKIFSIFWKVHWKSNPKPYIEISKCPNFLSTFDSFISHVSCPHSSVYRSNWMPLLCILHICQYKHNIHMTMSVSRYAKSHSTQTFYDLLYRHGSGHGMPISSLFHCERANSGFWRTDKELRFVWNCPFNVFQMRVCENGNNTLD